MNHENAVFAYLHRPSTGTKYYHKIDPRYLDLYPDQKEMIAFLEIVYPEWKVIGFEVVAEYH